MSSVDELKDLKFDAPNASSSSTAPVDNQNGPQQQDTAVNNIPQTQPVESAEAAPPPPPPPPAPPVMTVSQDPRYAGHFKMLKLVRFSKFKI